MSRFEDENVNIQLQYIWIDGAEAFIFESMLKKTYPNCHLVAEKGNTATHAILLNAE